MTEQEIRNRIEELERQEFSLQMTDHWTPADFDRDRQISRELNELKAQLKGE